MSLSMSLFMLVVYTALGYGASFKIPNDYFKKLQFVLFNLIVPPYIFLNIYNNLTVNFFLNNYFIIIGQVWFIVLALIFFKWIKSARQNVDFNVLAFQNAVFMALPIVVALPDSENLKLLVFMFMIGFNIAVFSLGAVVFSERASLKSIINVPFFASVVPIVLVFLGVRIGFEDSVSFMEKLLGFILMPGALFFFGGVINFSIQGKKILVSLELAKLVIVKYFLFPLITYILLLLLKVDKAIMIVFMLQSFMPPAVNLVLLPSCDEDKDQLSIQMMALYVVFMLGALVFVGYQLFS
jgi:predicted permease